MSTMALEVEKNELIRRILDVDDIAILKKVKSMLNSEEKNVNCVADETVPYYRAKTKAEVLEDLDAACKELKLNLEGKLEFKSAEDLLNEL